MSQISIFLRHLLIEIFLSQLLLDMWCLGTRIEIKINNLLGCCEETACDVFCDDGDIHAIGICGEAAFIARTIETIKLYWLLLYNIKYYFWLRHI